MRTMKGPGIFLSQFIGAEAPFNSLDGLAEWAAGKGYKAVQIPATIRTSLTSRKPQRARPTATTSPPGWPHTGWLSASCRPIWKGSSWR